MSASPRTVRVAALRTDFRSPTVDAWRARLEAAARDARRRGATLLALAEYAGLNWLPRTLPASVDEELDRCGDAWPDHLADLQRIATDTGLLVVGGTGLAPVGDRLHRNRCPIVSPDGTVQLQDKRVPTPWERTTGRIAPGDAQHALVHGDLSFGVAVCYDAEFPDVFDPFLRAGVDLLVVPSATDGPAGAQRVRVGCAARALEGQCAVLQVPTTDPCGWSHVVDQNIGTPAVFLPPDPLLDPRGVLDPCERTDDLTLWDLPIAALRAVRRHGETRNRADALALRERPR